MPSYFSLAFEMDDIKMESTWQFERMCTANCILTHTCTSARTHTHIQTGPRINNQIKKERKRRDHIDAIEFVWAICLVHAIELSGMWFTHIYSAHWSRRIRVWVVFRVMRHVHMFSSDFGCGAHTHTPSLASIVYISNCWIKTASALRIQHTIHDELCMSENVVFISICFAPISLYWNLLVAIYNNRTHARPKSIFFFHCSFKVLFLLFIVVVCVFFFCVMFMLLWLAKSLSAPT